MESFRIFLAIVISIIVIKVHSSKLSSHEFPPVIILDSANFSSSLAEENLVLVNIYAPWYLQGLNWG